MACLDAHLYEIEYIRCSVTRIQPKKTPNKPHGAYET
jgi:hypothetical protein